MRVRRVLVTAAAASALLLTGGLATGVSAVPSADINQVQRQVRDLQAKAESAAERANEAELKLQGIRSDLATVKNRAKREQRQLGTLTATINDIARSVYASGGFDPSLQVLLADDPAEFLAQASVMSQLEQSQLDQLRQTTTQRLRLAQTQAEIADKENAASRASAEMQSALADANQQYKKAQDLLATLKEEERQRLEALARKKRNQELAAAAAAASQARRQFAASSNGYANDASQGGAVDSGGISDAGSASAAAGGGFSGGTRAMVAVQYALSQVGKPYSYAARPPYSWDCSKLTAAAWGRAGVGLTPLSYTQFHQVRRIPVSEIQPGDLVFYFGSGAHHVAIYVGNGKMVSASNPSDGVELIDFLGPWYGERFSGAGRVVG